jgi:hypothetical protein
VAEVSGFNKNVLNNPNLQQPISNSRDVAQAGGVKGSQRVQRAVSKGTEQTAQKVQKQEIETISRRMTARDIVNQLLQLGIRSSQDNRALAMKMLVLGLELSKENFDQIDSLLRGLKRTAFTEQAAIIAVNKGLNSKSAVQQIANFLENNPQLSQQLSQVLNQTSILQSALQGQIILSPALTTQLVGIMASLEGAILALPDNIKRELKDGRGLLQRATLLTNMRAVKSLLTGLVEQVESRGSEENSQGLLGALNNLAKQAKDVAENLVVQSILSRPSEREDSAMSEKFSYWQIPNSLATPPQTFELLIQRDRKNKNKTINSRKTKVILKAETKSLGELAIEVEVDNNDLDLKFNTKEEEIRKLVQENVEGLLKKMESLNYKTKSVRVIKRNLDVKKYLIPTLDLNNLTRVQAEA